MNIEEVFYKGLERVIPQKDYHLQKRYLEEAVFNRVFLEAEKKNISWKRLGNKSFEGKINSQNYSGDVVEIPVFLDLDVDGDSGSESAYLCLFKSRNGPCRNDADKRVKNLMNIMNIHLM